MSSLVAADFSDRTAVGGSPAVVTGTLNGTPISISFTALYTVSSEDGALLQPADRLPSPTESPTVALRHSERIG
jgi:hypothetical protein